VVWKAKMVKAVGVVKVVRRIISIMAVPARMTTLAVMARPVVQVAVVVQVKAGV
jgi:hypothetical protein